MEERNEKKKKEEKRKKGMEEGRKEGGKTLIADLRGRSGSRTRGDCPLGSPTMSLRSSPQALALPSTKSTPLECSR